VVFDLLGTGWTIPWTTLVTVVVFWQPFTKDFVHWQQSWGRGPSQVVGGVNPR